MSRWTEERRPPTRGHHLLHQVGHLLQTPTPSAWFSGPQRGLDHTPGHAAPRQHTVIPLSFHSPSVLLYLFVSCGFCSRQTLDSERKAVEIPCVHMWETRGHLGSNLGRPETESSELCHPRLPTASHGHFTERACHRKNWRGLHFLMLLGDWGLEERCCFQGRKRRYSCIRSVPTALRINVFFP